MGIIPPRIGNLDWFGSCKQDLSLSKIDTTVSKSMYFLPLPLFHVSNYPLEVGNYALAFLLYQAHVKLRRGNRPTMHYLSLKSRHRHKNTHNAHNNSNAIGSTLVSHLPPTYCIRPSTLPRWSSQLWWHWLSPSSLAYRQITVPPGSNIIRHDHHGWFHEEYGAEEMT